ncbi:hypothetical protein [Lichenicoccus sp.]|uniref:hypothetical protein n=1 Tax=Lichenicoccus sp. TaxID=2781899 RepID=UPI003D0AAE05
MLEAATRDRWQILVAMAVVLLATGMAELLVAPTVTADAELMVLPQPGASPGATLRNETDILQSRPLAEAVVAAIGPQRLYPGIGAPESVQHAARRFAASFGATADAAGVIVVRFSHRDPAVAAQAVNQAVASYGAMRGRLYDNDRQRLLAAQVAASRRQLDAAEQAYAAFTVAHGSRYDTRIDILLHRKDSLEQELDQADIDLDQAQARLASDQPGARQDVQGVETRRTIVTARLAQVRDGIAGLEAQEPEFLSLRRQRDLAAASYQLAAQALDQSRIAGPTGPAAATVRVIQPAEIPQLSARRHLLILAAGTGLSLLAGLATAILSATLRRGFIDPGRIERDLGLPVLTSIAEWPAGAPSAPTQTKRAALSGLKVP